MSWLEIAQKYRALFKTSQENLRRALAICEEQQEIIQDLRRER